MGQIHFRTQQGIQNLNDAEAEALVAKDRESHGRDLFTAIPGDFPRWKLFIQVMTEAQAKTHKHNPFDLTKVWPKAEYPLIEVGVMELRPGDQRIRPRHHRQAAAALLRRPGRTLAPGTGELDAECGRAEAAARR